MDADRLVEDYLARLRAAAAGLPRGRREELVAEVQDHLRAALDGAGGRSESDVRNALDRLGRPEDIVAAEVGEDGAPEWGWGPLEVVAVAVLALGFVVPVVATLTGIVLVWFSSRWTTRQKAIATAIVAVPVALLAIGITSTTDSQPV